MDLFIFLSCEASHLMEFYIDIVYFLILFLAARVVTDRDTGRSRGFGFVTFYDEGDAQKAIDDLDGGVKLLSTMMATNSLINSLNPNIHVRIFQTDLQESRNQNIMFSRFLDPYSVYYLLRIQANTQFYLLTWLL